MEQPTDNTIHSPEWANLSDEELLKLRFCDLKLQVEHSAFLGEQIQALYAELEGKGLQFRPKIYLGDEWFSPDGMVAIAVPFFLAHPRLIALERKMMLEAEGETPEWCRKLLRHEAGHCFDHAYGFSKRRPWRDVFGHPSQEYNPDTYRPRPYSRSFVRHLDNWYAQAHPDEDFAETFAVWLTPGKDWKTEYKDWPIAQGKLEFIEKIARQVRNKTPVGIQGSLPFSASRMRSTLEKHYLKKRKERAQEYPDFYDSDLRRIFNGSSDLSKREFGAMLFMRRYRKQIVDSVSYWTGEKKYTIHGLVRKLTLRCESLDLRLGKSEEQTNLEVAAYLATLVTHYLFTGKFKRTV